MNRTVTRILNAALVVLCFFLAGRTVGALLGETLPTEEETVAATPRGAPPSKRWEDRQAILDRNLFNVSTLAPSDAAPVEVAPAEDLAETSLQYKLLGTASGTDDSARAAVEDLSNRSHQVVRVGDQLGGKAEVVSIERRRIVLRHNGRMEQLSLLEKDGGLRNTPPTASRRTRPDRARRAAMRPPRPAPSVPDVDIQQLGENRFSLDRGDVEAAAINPAALFSQARILPKYEGGEMVGIQLNSIKEGSLFQQIGIQEGDTVTTVNGVEVTGQQESAEVLRELTQAAEFDVTVTGADGVVRNLHYEVR